MSRLALKLAASERIIINGIVIENGHKSNQIFILTPNANILRLKDAIRPEDVRTPIGRICYIAQLILSGDQEAQAGHELILEKINELLSVFSDHSIRKTLIASLSHFEAGRTYAGLKLIRKILPIERSMLGMERP